MNKFIFELTKVAYHATPTPPFKQKENLLGKNNVYVWLTIWRSGIRLWLKKGFFPLGRFKFNFFQDCWYERFLAMLARFMSNFISRWFNGQVRWKTQKNIPKLKFCICILQCGCLRPNFLTGGTVVILVGEGGWDSIYLALKWEDLPRLNSTVPREPSINGRFLGSSSKATRSQGLEICLKLSGV